MASATAAFVLFALFFVSAQAHIPNLQRNVLTVTSTGKESIPSTIAVVNIGITARGKTALGVQKELRAKKNKVLHYLRHKKVSGVQSFGISLYPQYKYPSFGNGTRTLSGYNGNSNLLFEVNYYEIGVILDGVVRNGANNIYSVAFKGTEEAIQKARLVALRRAVKKARSEALVVALASGRRLGRAIIIKFGGSFPTSYPRYNPYPGSSGSPHGIAGSPPPASPNSQTLFATVTVTYRTY